MSHRFLFSDLKPKIVNRYPRQLALALAKALPDSEFLFVYYEPDDMSDEELLARLPVNSRVERIRYMKRHAIEETLQTFDPDVVLVTAQRIPDSGMVTVAKRLGIPTMMFQHGMYVDHLKRTPSVFISKMAQAFRYLRCVRHIANETGVGFLKLAHSYFQVWIQGVPISETALPSEQVNVDHVFVNGEYWKEWHHERYGYPLNAQILAGYPDLHKLGMIRKQPRERAVCYIAQTLVEDGRMSRKDMEAYMAMLFEAVGSNTFYIKLHPRSDRSLYAAFDASPTCHVVDEPLPHCTHYLGHYSTLLVVCLFLSPNLLLWEFEGHPVPDLLKDSTATVTDDVEKLKRYLQAPPMREEAPRDYLDDFEKYFYYDGNDPVDTAAAFIAKQFLGDGKTATTT